MPFVLGRERTLEKSHSSSPQGHPRVTARSTSPTTADHRWIRVKCAVSTTTRRVGVLPDELSGRVDPVLVTNLDVHDDPEVLNVARGRHLATSALEASLIPSGASPHTRPPLATFSAGQACCNRTCHESRLSHLTGSAGSATATAPGVGA